MQHAILEGHRSIIKIHVNGIFDCAIFSVFFTICKTVLQNAGTVDVYILVFTELLTKSYDNLHIFETQKNVLVKSVTSQVR